MLYLVKTPRWLKKLFHRYTWDLTGSGNNIYLTFDDGPHPTITPFVLDELKKVGAKATFFCIGKNVAAHPGIYQRILHEGHAVGNHTNNHLKGWKTVDDEYLENIAIAGKFIDSRLFRPPYGRIKKSQGRALLDAKLGFDIIMWDVLSGDFDLSISKEKCLRNVIQNTVPGSIIVFHDSEKAFERMEYAMPQVLKIFTEKTFNFSVIPSKTTNKR